MAFAQEPIPKFENLKPERQSEVASLLELATNNEKRGNYTKALSYYLEAHKLFPHPKLYYNIAYCYERLADAINAVKYYKLYVASMPKSKNTPKAKNRIQELQKKLVRQETSLRIDSSPPGATVYLNDITNGPVGTTPTTDLPIQPGKYKLIFKLEGYKDLVKEVEVKSGARQEVKFAMEALPKVKNPNAKTTSSNPVAPWVLLGVGIVGTGSAITFAVLRNNLIGDRDVNDKQQFTPEEWESKDTYEIMTYVSGGVAILGFAGALILFLTGSDGVALEAPVGSSTKANIYWPTPWLSTDGAGVGFQATF